MGKKQVVEAKDPVAIWPSAEEAYDAAKKGEVIVCVPGYEVWTPEDLKLCPDDTLFAGMVLGHWVRKGDQTKKKALALLDSYVADAREDYDEDTAPDFGST